MKTIKIGFGYPKSKFVPLAWAICWAEGTEFSHTYFRYTDDKEYVFHSTVAKGTHKLEISEFLKGYNALEEYEFDLSEAQFAKFLELCKENEGKPYSFKQLFGILFARIFGQKNNCLSKGSDVQVCAEVLLRVMQEVPEVFTNVAEIKEVPDLVGLKDMHDYVAKNARRVA